MSYRPPHLYKIGFYGSFSQMKSRTQQAISSVQKLLSSHGIASDRCEILQEASTLVLRLSKDLVGRVILDEEGPRVGSDFFHRETEVAEFLATHGAPVVGMHPQLAPGPYVVDDFVMNFWKFVHAHDADATPEEVGSSMAKCHQVLQHYPGVLDSLAILKESLALVPKLRAQNLLSEHTDLLEQSLLRSIAALSHYPMQAIHGDAHWGNVLKTSEGPIWMDWEDVFLGPVEWDLASIVWNHKFLDRDLEKVEALFTAYAHAGGSWNTDALEICYEARAAVICVWYPFLYPNPNADRQQKLQARLSYLKSLAPNSP